jgi:hypothetical protein
MDTTTVSRVDPPAVAKELDQQLAEQLVDRARSEGLQLTGPAGLLTRLTRRVLETPLETQLTDHLRYEAHDPVGRRSGNSPNGQATKKMHTDVGPVKIGVPRDRAGTFDPQPARSEARCDGMGAFRSRLGQADSAAAIQPCSQAPGGGAIVLPRFLLVDASGLTRSLGRTAIVGGPVT